MMVKKHREWDKGFRTGAGIWIPLGAIIGIALAMLFIPVVWWVLKDLLAPAIQKYD